MYFADKDLYKMLDGLIDVIWSIIAVNGELINSEIVKEAVSDYLQEAVANYLQEYVTAMRKKMDAVLLKDTYLPTDPNMVYRIQMYEQALTLHQQWVKHNVEPKKSPSAAMYEFGMALARGLKDTVNTATPELENELYKDKED